MVLLGATLGGCARMASGVSGKSKSTKYHNRPYFGQVLIEEADLYLTTNRRVRISSRPSACRIRMY